MASVRNPLKRNQLRNIPSIGRVRWQKELLLWPRLQYCRLDIEQDRTVGIDNLLLLVVTVSKLRKVPVPLLAGSGLWIEFVSSSAKSTPSLCKQFTVWGWQEGSKEGYQDVAAFRMWLQFPCIFCAPVYDVDCLHGLAPLPNFLGFWQRLEAAPDPNRGRGGCHCPQVCEQQCWLPRR